MFFLASVKPHSKKHPNVEKNGIFGYSTFVKVVRHLLRPKSVYRLRNLHQAETLLSSHYVHIAVS